MTPLIKSDGTTFLPPVPTGRGRKPKYPWAHIEAGDHFVTDPANMPTLNTVICTLKHAGWQFVIERSSQPGMINIKRIA